MIYLRLVVMVIVAFGVAHARAENPYVLGFSVAADSAGGRSVGGLIDYSFTDSTSAALDAAVTDADGVPVDIRTTQWEAAVAHDFGPLGIQASLGQSGDRDEFESDDWSIGLFRSFGPWRIDVDALWRDLKLTFRSPMNPDQQVRSGARANGITANLSYTADSGAGIFINASRFDYNRDITRLDQFRLARLLSPSSLTLSGSLLDHSASLGLDWPVGERVLSVTVSRDRLAIDRSDVDSLALGWLTPLGSRSDLDIGVGISRDGAGTQYFLSLLFLRYGGID